MTAPGESVSIDDVELMSDDVAPAAKPFNPADVKLEGDNVPENLRGKSLADVIEQSARIAEALRISEDARLALARSTEPRTVVVERDRAPAGPTELTEDQLNTLFQENPAAAAAYVTDRTERRMAAHFEQRFGSMASAGIGNARALAEKAYPLEFAIFKNDIDQIVGQMTDKSALGSVDGWGKLVSYVRGQDGNIDKFVEAKAGSRRDEARDRERESAGFVAAGNTARDPNPPKPVATSDLDDTQKRIARNMFTDAKTDDEAYKLYKKWSTVGN